MNTHDIEERARAALAELTDLRADDAPTHGGRILSYVYDPGLAILDDVAAAAARQVQSINGLDPTVFSSVARMEQDLITFGRTVFHGPTTVGSVTSGGTESCLLAVKSARDAAGAVPGTASMVLPTTAHAAFLKAAELFGVRTIRVPVSPVTTAVDPESVAAAVDADTVLIVASAPNYPTGTLDPIADIADIARSESIEFHVDACLGGFALPWWQDVPPWDFRVPGVTSLSADLHKYGYAPKGSSLLLYTNRDRHRAQYFSLTDWPGYPVVNPTLLGSRSAGGLAAAWAVSKTLGDSGFGELVAIVESVTQRLLGAFASIPGLRVVGAPTGPVFAVAADEDATEPVDPHRWGSAMAELGFAVQAQPRFTQTDGSVLPATAHLTITPVTATVAEEFIEAAGRAAADVAGAPPAAAPPALAELAAAFDAGTVTVADALALPSDAAEQVLLGAGIDPHAGGADQLDMPAIIAAVESLPRPITARLLAEFLAAYCSPTADSAAVDPANTDPANQGSVDIDSATEAPEHDSDRS